MTKKITRRGKGRPASPDGARHTIGARVTDEERLMLEARARADRRPLGTTIVYLAMKALRQEQGGQQ